MCYVGGVRRVACSGFLGKVGVDFWVISELLIGILREDSEDQVLQVLQDHVLKTMGEDPPDKTIKIQHS